MGSEMCIRDSFTSCTNESGLHQKIRECSDNEGFYRLLMLFVITVSTLYECLAIYQLHKQSDHKFLYQISKSWLCLPLRPVIHRSVLIKLVREDSNENLKDLQSILTELSSSNNLKPFNEMVNRPIRGETPLHIAMNHGALQCAEIMLELGVIPKPDFEGKLPNIGNLLENEKVIRKYNECKKMGIFPNSSLKAMAQMKNHRGKTLKEFSLSLTPLADLLDLLQISGKGSHFTKQNVTLWAYQNEKIDTIHVNQLDSVEVM